MAESTDTEANGISHTNRITDGAYRVDVDGSDKPAELTWKARGPTRIVDHTFVPPKARGKGIAMKLVEAIVADAREEGFTIEPQCPYVEAAFRRNAQWADVRAPIPS